MPLLPQEHKGKPVQSPYIKETQTHTASRQEGVICVGLFLEATHMEQQAYDYIVVGAGPAGCVVAKTLSNDLKSSVLLLEAGGNDDADPLITNADSNLYAHFPEYFWFGQSIPQPNVNGRDFALTGGRTRGGGSSVNGEMYVRPSPFVLRQWVKAGGPQWSQENVTQAFVELERFHGVGINPKAHGNRGPLDIRQNYPDSPSFIDKFASAFEMATGCKSVKDYNDPATPIGPFKSWQLYQKPDGSRASASVAFLPPDVVDSDGYGVGGRKLTVMDRSTAVRIRISPSKRAVGVSFISDGEPAGAIAARKVIVCAGGLRSAQLLMHSGIGPAEVLEKAGVPVHHNSHHVGRNLAGDACTSAVISMNPDDYREMVASDPNARVHGGAFLPAPYGSENKDERSIQIIVTGASEQAIHLSILCVNPKSRGSLMIQSSDPLKVMLGDFGFLRDYADVQTLMDTLRKYVAPMAELLHKEDPAYRLISPSHEVLADDEKLRGYIRETFMHTYHDQGALRMGSEDDGVVNGWGEVYGVKDLVVADTSIIPYHTDGNTSACAYLTGYIIAQHLASK